MQVNTNSTTRQSVSVNMTINSVQIKQVFICVWGISLCSISAAKMSLLTYRNDD